MVQDAHKDHIAFSRVIRVLCEFALVEADCSDADSRTGYSVHECVHSWTVHVLGAVSTRTSANWQYHVWDHIFTNAMGLIIG